MGKTNNELIALIKDGKNKQDNLLALYKQNKGFIYRLCKQYSGRVEMADLLQESFLLLAEAVDKYDPNSDYAFLTLFRYVFITHFNRYMATSTAAMAIPCHLSNAIKRYKRMTNTYEQELNKIPDDATYCRELKITYSDLANIRKYLNHDKVLSLDYEYSGTDRGTFSLVDLVEDPEDMNEEVLNAEQLLELREALDIVLDRLPSDGADILRQYFYYDKSLKDYAEEKGITVQAASSRKNNAINKIRKTPESLEQLHYFINYDDVKAYAYRRKGVKAFMADRTSATETAAFNLLDLERKKTDLAKKQLAYYRHIATKYMLDEQEAVEHQKRL